MRCIEEFSHDLATDDVNAADNHCEQVEVVELRSCYVKWEQLVRCVCNDFLCIKSVSCRHNIRAGVCAQKSIGLFLPEISKFD